MIIKRIFSLVVIPALFFFAGSPCFLATGSDAGWCAMPTAFTALIAIILLALDIGYITKVFNLNSKKIFNGISIGFLILVAVVIILALMGFILSF